MDIGYPEISQGRGGEILKKMVCLSPKKNAFFGGWVSNFKGYD